jgi:chaperonin GroES
MTASSSGASRPRKSLPAASSSRIPPKEKPSEGEVIAVGPGGRDEAGKLIPIDVRVGDRVLFGKWSGTEVKIDGEELLIMKESDIMGIIDEPVAKNKKKAA